MSKSENGIKQSRLCHVIKKDDFDGYGFNLHAEKGKPGQYIGKVDDGSPAESAGLKQGDRIIEVNGVNIGSETHKQVVQRIKAIASEVQLLVVDPSVPVTKDNHIVSDQTDSKSLPTPDIVVQIASAPSSPRDDNSSINSTSSPPTSIEVNATESPKSQKTQQIVDSPNQDKKITDYSSSSPQKSTTTAAPLHQNGSSATKSEGASLNLNMTAAELRARLAAKKKFDPKNDSVDLRKKFEIVQKL